MIDLLGKRPFVGRSDDMDKWLDDNRERKGALPPPSGGPGSEIDDPMPGAAVAVRTLDDKLMH